MTSFQLTRAKFIRFYEHGVIAFARTIFLLLGMLGLTILLLRIFLVLPNALVGLGLLLLAPANLVIAWNLFVSYLKAHPQFMMGQDLLANPLNKLDFDAAEVLSRAGQPITFAGLLLASGLNNKPQEVLLRLGLTPDRLKTLEPAELNREDLKRIIATAAKNNQIATIFDLLGAVFAEPQLKPILDQNKLETATVSQVIAFYNNRLRQANLEREFWLRRGERTGGIGKDWATSYTNLIDSIAAPVPGAVVGRATALPLGDRQEILPDLTKRLSQSSGQNVLLVGEEGIGRQEIIFHLAAQLLTYQTKTPLDGYSVRILDVQRLLAIATSPSQIQQLIGEVFAELSRGGNIILYIDPIATLLDGNHAGGFDLGNALQAYLSNPNIHIIGAINSEQYVVLIKPNPTLAQNFSVVNVPEPNLSSRLTILLSQLYRFEGRYQVFWTVAALEELIRLAAEYVKDRVSPSRELEIMEEISNSNHAAGKTIVTVPDVTAAIEKIAQVPLQVEADDQQKLMNLAAELHTRVIGQEAAIKEVSDALLRARAGLNSGQKPVGSFLFLGPTGVGKTETAKALAEIYYGSSEKLIRLDMTEYADELGLQKLLGSDPVNQPGALTVAIQRYPSAVMLFDEFEKASVAVKNTMLQLLDEGRLTTNYGKALDFTNCIIITTSNAGSEYIKEKIASNVPSSQFEKSLIDALIRDKVFSPELLNRFDAVTIFTSLSKEEITQVVNLRLKELAAGLNHEKKITLQISPAVVEELASEGYDPVFGARALQRVINTKLETKIAKQIIAINPPPGSTLAITDLND